jgi:L-alanine-DL-glutamate epimerase-like enolase superfamily enzyme
LVTNTSVLPDFETKPGGWFGPAFCTLVEVRAEDGTIGVGTAGAFNGAAKSIVDMYLADLLHAQDIENHEGVWQRMYRSLIRFGRSGPAVAALSAVDIALWDLHGRLTKTSATTLLGGRVQAAVPCYVSRLYALDDLEELAREAEGYVNQGFRALKQRFGYGPRDGYSGMAANVRLVQTVREAVGPDIELAADAYMGWDYGYALEMARRLEPFNLSWIEEALMPQLVHLYADLRAARPHQRWSCGEHSYTKWDFEELIRSRAVDILQPDFNRAGGLTEARKICALAETAGLPVYPHSNEVHNLAIIFGQSGHVCPVVEYFPQVEPDTGNELFWNLFTGNAQASDGFLTYPDRPGLGVDINEAVAQDLTVVDGDWIPLSGDGG